MKAIVATVIAIGLSVAAMPAQAQSGPYDHYKCYRVKDSAKFLASVDLTAFQQQFNVDPQCRVKGKARVFCVPVIKDVLSLVYPKNSTLTPVVMPGQDLLEDRLCYKIKCPASAVIASEEVQDQFGTRKIGKFKATMLCTNAIKTSFTTTTTSTTIVTTTTTLPQGCSLDAAGQCSGTCPNPVDICTILTDGTCDCVPPQQDCSLDPLVGICGGLCPDPADVCMTFPGGFCDCVRPCEMDAAGFCGGQCPAGQVCDVVAGTNQCGCQ